MATTMSPTARPSEKGMAVLRGIAEVAGSQRGTDAAGDTPAAAVYRVAVRIGGPALVPNVRSAVGAANAVIWAGFAQRDRDAGTLRLTKAGLAALEGAVETQDRPQGEGGGHVDAHGEADDDVGGDGDAEEQLAAEVPEHASQEAGGDATTQDLGHEAAGPRAYTPEQVEWLGQAVALEKKALQDEREVCSARLARAKERLRDARRRYREAVEATGGRRSEVTARVRFLVEVVGDAAVRVAIAGRPETTEEIPTQDIRDAITRVSYGYAERHIGPREKAGNKGGTLSNRLRAALREVDAATETAA